MVKSIKTIVKDLNTELTRREASRKAQNERRKLQRRLANILSKETGKKVSWKESINVYEGQKSENILANEIYGQYKMLQYRGEEQGYKRVGYGVNIQEMQQKNAERFPNQQTQRRRNEMFRHELNEASKKEGEGISSLNKGEVHAFYAATQFIWSGTSVQENRNLKIMEGFGVDSLETIYKLIVNKELDYKEFGFSSEDAFNKWLDEISRNIDVRELREIYQEELHEQSDIPETKYNKVAIANIITRTSMLKKHA